MMLWIELVEHKQNTDENIYCLICKSECKVINDLIEQEYQLLLENEPTPVEFIENRDANEDPDLSLLPEKEEIIEEENDIKINEINIK